MSARMTASPPAPEARRAMSRRRLIAGVGTALVTAALLYGLLPRLAGVEETWARVRHGDPAWLAVAAAFEVASFAGYVALFRVVLGEGWFGWRVSLLITLAGVAATRLLATGGAGGIALTAWALTRAGRGRGQATVALTAFLVTLYVVFMLVLVVGGLGLWTGVLPGPAPVGLTLVPAGFGAAVIAAALCLALLRIDTAQPADPPDGPWLYRVRHLVRRGAGLIAAGVRHALTLVRRGDPRLLGALAWWGFDVAVLWACLEAFGDPPAAAPLVMAYFVGMLGNLLPLPGGVGGIDGAMIGALIGFGVAGGLAIVGVLAYRLLAFWLPTLVGIPAYAALVRVTHGWPAGG